MSNGDWIGLVFGIITVLTGFVAWLGATYMRIGKILQEVKYMNKEVTTLTTAYDSQEKKLHQLDTRVTVVEKYVETQHEHTRRAHA